MSMLTQQAVHALQVQYSLSDSLKLGSSYQQGASQGSFKCAENCPVKQKEYTEGCQQEEQVQDMCLGWIQDQEQEKSGKIEVSWKDFKGLELCSVKEYVPSESDDDWYDSNMMKKCCAIM
eukprot:TRINITY_DN1312_c0_g1_i12.p12 TRINITY_DN1312_c0_g1~~TRINITY_DN1312_c0_g1_i12.p12  ORF type:complete len:120 (-),score=8.69 TRINITY_DN1312_c0_g1_i12:1884-2243(-)